MDSDSAVDDLIDVMKSTTYPVSVRIGAAEGLGFTGYIIARKALHSVMKSTTHPETLRAAAAKALGRAVR